MPVLPTNAWKPTTISALIPNRMTMSLVVPPVPCSISQAAKVTAADTSRGPPKPTRSPPGPDGLSLRSPISAISQTSTRTDETTRSQQQNQDHDQKDNGVGVANRFGRKDGTEPHFQRAQGEPANDRAARVA